MLSQDAIDHMEAVGEVVAEHVVCATPLTGVAHEIDGGAVTAQEHRTFKAALNLEGFERGVVHFTMGIEGHDTAVIDLWQVRAGVRLAQTEPVNMPKSLLMSAKNPGKIRHFLGGWNWLKIAIFPVYRKKGRCN